jgi:hypothetical protein
LEAITLYLFVESMILIAKPVSSFADHGLAEVLGVIS